MLDKLRGRYGRKADLREQASAYRQVFGSAPAVRYVVPDIAEYCGVLEPIPSDPLKAQRHAGRLDVWRRIQHHLHLNEQEIYALLMGQPIVRQKEETDRGGMV